MKIFWRIVKYIRPYTGKFILHFLTMLIGVSLLGFTISFLDSILKILFSGESTNIISNLKETPFGFLDQLNDILIKNIKAADKMQALSVSILIIVGLFLLSNIFRYISQLLMNSIRTRVIQNIRENTFDKTSKLQIAYFEGEKKGDIMTRFSADLVNVEQAILSTLESLIRDPYTILLFIFLMVNASPMLTLYIFVLLPTMAIIITFIGRSLKKNSFKTQEKLSQINTVIDEFTSGIRVVKAFNAENYIKQVFNRYNNGYRRQSKKVLNKHRAIPLISESLGIITIGVFLYFSGKLVFQGSLDYTLILVFVVYFQQITQPAKKLSQAYGNIMKGAASGERIFELMDAPVQIEEKENAQSIQQFEESLIFKNVNFAYDSRNVLRNINIEIPKGKVYALVGKSGSGKTTFAELILRFYDVSEGQILIDNNDLRDLKLKDLRELIAIVTQEPILFNDTIFNNIAFGLGNISEDTVIEAAKAANAHEFIMDTEQGYRSIIGERGSLLSGGQKQRLSIARAILKNPPILILDEATSSLDTSSEKIVQDALERLMKKRTSIVIAHRLSTIQNADMILVMDEGKIKEKGSHQELISQNRLYKKLYELQQLTGKEV